jgi:hypothetical protein
VVACAPTLLIMLLAQPSAGPAPTTRHPVITEVLFAVPPGKDADASGDGVRVAVGDEFVELLNATDARIDLKGYTLVDADAWNPGAAKPAAPSTPATPNSPGPDTPKPKRDADRPPDRPQFRFTFPATTLAPGQVVVIFNGHKTTVSTPVGTPAAAPPGPNPRFHNALVFTLNNPSPYAALGNERDFVLLLAPDGTPVHAVRWGKPAKNPPADCPRIDEIPAAALAACSGSFTRQSATGPLLCHRDLTGDLKGSPFSPGLFTLAPPSPSTAPAPGPGPTPARPSKPAPAGRP